LRLDYVGYSNPAKSNTLRPNWYRTFQIPNNATLDQLSFTILQILNWDTNHLYEFRVNDRIHTQFGATEQFVYADDNCLSCDIPLYLLGLSLQHTFTFTFDFAYYHTFRLTILDIVTSPSKNNTWAVLISYRGRNLIQRPETGDTPTLAALTHQPPKVLTLGRPTNPWRARFIRVRRQKYSHPVAKVQ
jgi:hypothetical protein